MKLSFPPVITLACIAGQFILYLMLPLQVNLSLLLGLMLLIASIGLIVMSFKELQNNETTYVPDGEPEQLVTTGPFSFSRNPIYLGMFGILLATAFLMNLCQHYSYLFYSYPSYKTHGFHTRKLS
tara:strand:- start:97 stop:471 length:375 start_codon:yes stop_codon:yes gene_type:complete